MAERARRYLIVGNGVAGTTAAETLRKNDPDCAITLFTDEPLPLYNRVALPPYIKHRTTHARVFMRSMDQHRERKIDLRLETRVNRIDPDGRTVLTSTGEELPFDSLLIATGGRATPLSVEGSLGVAGIFNFQTFGDAELIVEQMKVARSATVVGGSYIAYELAEAFRHNGLETTWIIRGPHFLRRILDSDGGGLVDQIAREHGVQMVYGEEIATVESSGGTISAIVSNRGRRVETGMLGLGLGLQMNIELLTNTGIKAHTGVIVDKYLQTAIPGIFAAGDVAEFFDVSIGRHNMMGTWGNAGGHGRIVGLNMAGRATAYEDVPMYSSSLFDSYIRVIGLTPENLPEVEACSRLDSQKRAYQRLFFFENRLVGAVLIGDMRYRQRIFAAIRARETVKPDQRACFLTALEP